MSGKHYIENISVTQGSAVKVRGGVVKTTGDMQVLVGGQIEWLGRIVAILHDRNNQVWVALHRLGIFSKINIYIKIK